MMIGIIGLGLIGGSLACGFKARADIPVVAFSRSEKALEQAYQDGVITEYSTDDLSIFKDCDLIFICTPVDKITYYVDKLIPIIKKDCILTDVGSTKKQICDEMEKYDNVNFIGGHPMAGSEESGYKAAKEYLFENAYYILTPNVNIKKEQIDSFLEYVKILGAIPIVADSDYHDYIVAAVSHVPHIISSSLVNTVKNLDDERELMHTLAAGGFKDITRIASSNPEIWRSICFENKKEVLKVLQSFKDSIDEFEKFLMQDNEEQVYDFFDDAKNYRDSFSNKGSALAKTYRISVDIFDKPGTIATVVTMLSVNNINIKNVGIVNNRDYSGGVMQIVFDHEEDMKKSIELLNEMNFNLYI